MRRRTKKLGIVSGFLLSAAFSGALAIGVLSGINKQSEVITKAEIDPEDLIEGWNYDEDEMALVYYDPSNLTAEYELSYIFVRTSDNEVDLTYVNVQDQTDTQEITIQGTFNENGNGLVQGYVNLNGAPDSTYVEIAEGSANVEYDTPLYDEGWNYVEQDYALIYWDGEDVVGYVLETVYLCQYSMDAILIYSGDLGTVMLDDETVILTEAYINQSSGHLIGTLNGYTRVELNIGSITPQETEYWTYSNGFIWIDREGNSVSTANLGYGLSSFHEYLEDTSFNYYELIYTYNNENLPKIVLTNATWQEVSGATASGYEITGDYDDLQLTQITINVREMDYNQEQIKNGWMYDPNYDGIVYYINNGAFIPYVVGTPIFYEYGTEENYVEVIYRAEPTNADPVQETIRLTNASCWDPHTNNNNTDNYKVQGKWNDSSIITIYLVELENQFQSRWYYDNDNGFQYWYDSDDICFTEALDVIFTNFGNGRYYNEAFITFKASHYVGQELQEVIRARLYIEQAVLQTDPRLLSDEPGLIRGKWNDQDVEVEVYADDDHPFIENVIETGWNYITGLEEIVYIADENDQFASEAGQRFNLEITQARVYRRRREIVVTYALNDEWGWPQTTGTFTLQSADVLSAPGNNSAGIIKGYTVDLGRINTMIELKTYVLDDSLPYLLYDENNQELYEYYPDPAGREDISTELYSAEYDPETDQLDLYYYVHYTLDGEPVTDGDNANLTGVEFIQMPDPSNPEPALRTGYVQGYCDAVGETITLAINIAIVGKGTPGWKYDQESGISWVDEYGFYYNGENEKLQISGAVYNTTLDSVRIDFYIEEFDEIKPLTLTDATVTDIGYGGSDTLWMVEGKNTDLTNDNLQFQVSDLTETDGINRWTWYQGDLSIVNPWNPDITVKQLAVTYYEESEVVELVYEINDPTQSTYSTQTLTLTEAEVYDEYDPVTQTPGLVSGKADFIEGMVDPISVNVTVEIDRPSLFSEGWNFIDEQLMWYDETLGICDTSFNFVTIYYNEGENGEELEEYAEVKYAIYGLDREDPDAITYKTAILTNIKVGGLPDDTQQEPGFLTGTYAPLDAGILIEFFSDQFKYKRVGEEDENPATITPEQAEEIVDFLPEVQPVTREEEERQARTDESLAQLSEKTAAEILTTVTAAQDAIDQELADKMATATTEEEKAQAVQEHKEKREIIETVTEASVVVGAGQQTAAEEGKKINDALPEDNGLDESMEKTLDDFYKLQMDYLLGREEIPDKEQKSSGKRGILRAPDSNSTGINMNVTAQEYGKMIKFVDTAVSNMKDAALQIRKCSAATMKASINIYISKVKVSKFREFDEETANNEFVAAVYKAIMLNMQQQVIEALKREHKPSNNAEKEQQYQEQLKACEDYNTFEEIVLEVLRLKYVSLTKQEIEINDFRPIYDQIFRSWALDDPSINPTSITLEELTKATIEKTTTKASKVELKEEISKQESTFLIVFGAAIGITSAAAIAAPIIIKSSKRRRRLAK